MTGGREKERGDRKEKRREGDRRGGRGEEGEVGLAFLLLTE